MAMKTARSFSAIVPVAGTGTRLRPHTNTYPKVLLTVGHKPILGHILDQLSAIGAGRIYLVVGHLGVKIREYVARAYPGLDVVYVEQTQPRGLGHAVWLAAAHIKGPVFILLGDTILSADMRKFVKFRQDCIGVHEVADPRRFGVVETKGGCVSRLIEKPARPSSNLAIVGAYSFRKCEQLYENLNALIESGKTTRGEIQLTDAIMGMVAKGAGIRPVAIEGWYDCGKPAALLETNRYLLDRHRKELAVEVEGSLVRPPVYIAPTARITGSIIGPNASIGEGAKISGSIISDSIINEKATIRRVVLGKSLIGPSAMLAGRGQQINIGENSEIYLDSSGDAGE